MLPSPGNTHWRSSQVIVNTTVIVNTRASLLLPEP
jgi:hypothetical protein